jgi:hypothetical protein
MSRVCRLKVQASGYKPLGLAWLGHAGCALEGDQAMCAIYLTFQWLNVLYVFAAC